MDPIIQIENLSKLYRLGLVGTGTVSHDINRWWSKVRGKENPYLKIGESNISSDKSKSGYVWALKDINLEVMPGEILGIIGKNGAGKSTLLKILSRVTGPTKGRISYSGRIGSLLEVGTGFHPEFTGRENIFLNGAILGMSKLEIKRKLDEIIDFAGVVKYIDTPVKRYSSGMKVRLGFAVAAHLEPEILVVDEVLAVGDAEFQAKAIGKMQDVSQNSGRTVLFVSHNMASIQKLCTSLLVIDKGTISYNGEVNTGIAKYISSSAINSNLEINRHSYNVAIDKPFGIKDISILSDKDEKIQIAYSGMSINLKINYFSNLAFKFLGVRIVCASHNGAIMFVLEERFIGSSSIGIPDNGVISCNIPKLPLTPGKYFFHVLIVRDGIEILEDIEYAKELIVESGDFFGTGKLPEIQSVLVNNNFSINKS